MKSIITVSILFFSLCAAAQAPPDGYTIITVEGEASVGSQKVFIGQKIDSLNSIIIVGKKSYVGILTDDGSLFKIKKGKYTHRDIFDIAHQDLSIGYAPSVATVHRITDQVEILGVPEDQYSGIYGDSLFLTWGSYKTGASYKVLLYDSTEHRLFDATTPETFFIKDIRALINRCPSLLYKVIVSPGDGDLHPLKKVNQAEATQIKNDLRQMQNIKNKIQRDIVRIAYFDLQALYFDQMRALYTLVLLEKKGTTVDNPYFQALVKKYNLDNL